DRPERSAHDILREFWKIDPKIAGSEDNWRRWLHDGVIPNTAFTEKHVSVTGNLANSANVNPANPGTLELAYRNDPSVLDGRFANNGWLQELPKPITKLTWDNAILLSPATAAKVGASASPAYQGGEHGQI